MKNPEQFPSDDHTNKDLEKLRKELLEKGKENMDQFRSDANRVEKVLSVGKGWNEVQEAERRVRAENELEKIKLPALDRTPRVPDVSDPRDSQRVEKLLMALRQESEKHGFSPLRWETSPEDLI